MLRTVSLLLLAFLSLPAWATELPTQISSDTTLSLAQSPYFLQSSVSVDAGVTVTIEPGVEIIAAGDYRLFVNGTLTGGDAAGAPIVFRAADAAARGAWEGLYVAATGVLRLTNATISNGVNDLMAPGGQITLNDCHLTLASTDALFAWNHADVRCSNCDFASNTGRGVYCEGYQATGLITGCRFTSNGSYPVQLKARLMTLLGSDNTFTDNAIQRIGVSCSLVDDVTGVAVWPQVPVPIELGAGGGDATLTIAAGAQLTLPGGATIIGGRVDCKGQLDVLGSLATPTVFGPLPEAAVAGGWAGLSFGAGSVGRLTGVLVQQAVSGLTADGAALTVQDTAFEGSQYDGARVTGAATLAFTNVSFRNNGRCGLRLEGQGTTGTVQDCQFLACGSTPVWSLAGNLRCLLTGNVYAGNAVARIGVSCGASPDLTGGAHVWLPQGLPLDCGVNSTGAVLNIASGASLTIRGGQTLYLGGVEAAGTFNVEATAADPCLFLPASGAATPGAWNGLRYSGSGGRLRGAVVRYGSNGLSLTNASPLVTECAFCDSQYDGLVCAGASRPVVTRTALTDNGRHGVYTSGTAQPNLGDVGNAALDDQGENVLSGNGGYDFHNGSTSDIKAQNNTWSSTDLAVVASRVYDRVDQSGRGTVSYQPLLSLILGNAPVLSWTGATGYTNDGFEPSVVAPGVPARFRVSYAQSGGKAPLYVRLHVLQGATPLAGSPFAMALIGGANYTTGAVYGVDVPLAATREVRYWFAAADADNVAIGPPTMPHNGPQVNTSPVLTFSPDTGYRSDGVDPNSGPVGTLFEFRCVYTDADGDEPTFVRCHLKRSGVAVAGSPFVMTPLTDAACASGRPYGCSHAIGTAGTYTVAFEASDGVATAGGSATVARTGPTVSAQAPMVTGLLGVQLRTDQVEIQWRQVAAGAVTIDLLNLAGRSVAHVCRNVDTASGDASALWGRRLPSGAFAPAGHYVLVLEAVADGGQRWRAMAPLTLR